MRWFTSQCQCRCVFAAWKTNNSYGRFSLSLDYSHYNFYWSCHPFFGIAIVRSLWLLVFHDLEGSVNIFVAIKTSSTVLRHRHRTVDRYSISVWKRRQMSRSKAGIKGDAFVIQDTQLLGYQPSRNRLMNHGSVSKCLSNCSHLLILCWLKQPFDVRNS